MSDNSWLNSQLDRAKREVQSWDEWKRDAMRRQATLISLSQDMSHADDIGAIDTPSGSIRPTYNPPQR